MGSPPKRWNGTSWVLQASSGKVWDGSTWNDLDTGTVWDSSTWNDLDTGVSDPTTTFWYSFEGGTATNDVSTSDTGSGTQFDNVSYPYMRYETAGARNGSLGGEIDSGTTLTSYVQWDGSANALNAVGFWFKPASFPTGDTRIIDLRNTSSSGTVGGVLLRSDGTLRLMVGTSGQSGQTSSATSTGSWYWVSLGWDATNKTAHLKISNDNESTFYDSTVTGITSSYTDLTTTRIGRVTTSGDIGNCRYDDLQFNQGSATVLAPWTP